MRWKSNRTWASKVWLHFVIIWPNILLNPHTDCRVCNRRRIKCDRRLPTCNKCEKRGLQCSGYGLILKWDQGIASRGNLKGKSLPLPSKKRSTTSLELFSRTDFGVRSDEFNNIILDPVPTSKPEVYTIPQPLMTSQLQIADHRRLLYHFDRIVAPNMAWAGTLTTSHPLSSLNVSQIVTH
jgi:hypothetical protein